MIIDLGGFDQYEIDGTNILISGENLDCLETFALSLCENYPEAIITAVHPKSIELCKKHDMQSITGSISDKSVQAAVESIHHNYIFACYAQQDFSESVLDYFLKLNEMMGSTAVLIIYVELPIETNYLSMLQRCIREYSDFNINPVTIILTEMPVNRSKYHINEYFRATIEAARNQKNGLFVLSREMQSQIMASNAGEIPLLEVYWEKYQ